MNKLISMLVFMSVFSVAQESNSTLEGTLSSKGITRYTKLLNSWFGTDMKVVNVELNTTLVTLPAFFVTPIEDKKVHSLKSNKLTIDVPQTKLTLEVDSRCIVEYSKNIYNAEAGVRYTFESGLGLETGYKLIRLKSDEIEDLSLKSDALGLYGKLVMVF